MNDLLPDDFDELISAAVQVFWRSRESGTSAQGGTRGKVLSGKNMDGFVEVVEVIAQACGVPGDCVFGRNGQVNLPGRFRPNKDWDALVVYEGRLIAAFEFKSQVGSFGNNFNNRTEEALGNAVDLGKAYEYGAFKTSNYKRASRLFQRSKETGDVTPPFVGYLMLLQDCDGSRKSRRASSTHFNVDPAFEGASYADRYDILCQRLVEEKLYSGACLILSPEGAVESGEWTSLSRASSARKLFTGFAGHLRTVLV